jgi:hypothetical protein
MGGPIAPPLGLQTAATHEACARYEESGQQLRNSIYSIFRLDNNPFFNVYIPLIQIR